MVNVVWNLQICLNSCLRDKTAHLSCLGNYLLRCRHHKHIMKEFLKHPSWKDSSVSLNPVSGEPSLPFEFASTAVRNFVLSYHVLSPAAADGGRFELRVSFQAYFTIIVIHSRLGLRTTSIRSGLAAVQFEGIVSKNMLTSSLSEHRNTSIIIINL